jgi:hypothetical protein
VPARARAEILWPRAPRLGARVRHSAPAQPQGPLHRLPLPPAPQAYVDAFRQLAKEGNTLLLPAAVDSPSTMVAQALSVFKAVGGGSQIGGGGGSSSGGGGGGAVGAAPKAPSSAGSGAGRAAAMAAAPAAAPQPAPAFSLRAE